MPFFRPPLHPRSALPPPRRVGFRCPTPVGHGRGLASRPGCAGPGEGVGSPWLHLATSGVRRYRFAPPASARLRPASPTPGERGRRRSVPATSPAASRCSPSLATLSVCLWWCLTESGRGYCRPTLLPYPSASTACRRPSLCSDADLLCPLSALTLATGQVFTADHASVSIVPQSLPSAAATA